MFGREGKSSPFFARGSVVGWRERRWRMQREVSPLPSPRESVGGAEIYTGRGLLAALPEAVDGMTGGGRVLLVRDGEGREVAGRAEELLKGFGFRVTAKDAADADKAEECCLLALGIGGGEAADAAKRAAKELGAECALFPVVPCEDGLLTGGGVRAVYLDDDVLGAAPADSRAAAAGFILSAPVRRFEDAYAAKVLARKPVNVWDFSFSEEEPPSAAALKVMKTGLADGTYAPDVTADMLRCIALSRGKTPRRKGEYVFAAACALAAFYKAYLSSPAIDTLVPADHGAALDEIARLTGGEKGKLMQAFDIFDVSGYFRINYILGEYRMDLLAELSSSDLGGAERKWRRMYDDAGFWMKSAFTSGDMIRAMALAGELSGGLLAFAAATGFFAAMTAEERTGERKKSA